MTKIVRIIARLNVGGPAQHVVWVTAGLRDKFETLLVTGTVPPGEEDMGYFARACDVEPYVIPEMSREISLKDAFTVWKLYRLFQREKPDIVHTHTAKAGTAGRIAGLVYKWITPGTFIGRPRRCRFVHTYHGHVFHSYYGKFKTKSFLGIEKLLARIATDKIIVISRQQLNEIHHEFGVGRMSQIQLVPLGLDLDRFSGFGLRRGKVRAELNADDHEHLIGIVGRLTEVKNHKLFLEAVAKWKAEFGGSGERIRFVIIGDGHLRQSLEKLARELAISDIVEFLGNRTDPEYFYPALDAVALTSLNEGTPLTLIEAMANALPCIATKVGGVVDLAGDVRFLQDENIPKIHDRAILVDSGSSEQLSKGFQYLLQNSELGRELGSRGRSFVTENYSKDRLLRDLTSLYSELLDEGNECIVADSSLRNRAATANGVTRTR